MVICFLFFTFLATEKVKIMYVALIFLLDSYRTKRRQSRRDLKHGGQGTDHGLIFRILNWCPPLGHRETGPRLLAPERVISERLRFIHLPGSKPNWDGVTHGSHFPGFWENETWRQKREEGV